MKQPPPENNRQYHSYGVRYWNGTRWMYRGATFKKGRGWTPAWIRNECKCYSSTSLLSAMFEAQSLAMGKRHAAMEVVEFVEPKMVWATSKNSRTLELENIETYKQRT